MDEVDKIIVHTLRDIGCSIDEETASIASFTPEVVVRATAACLQQIKPNATLPKFLPAGMALRFAVATTLAEECAACGYRGDIGYQSFLYPSSIDVRRLLMFLIEQLPKDNQQSKTNEMLNKTPLGSYEILRREIKSKVQQQLRAPWVPQYCRLIGNQRQIGCSSMNLAFTPQLNLNIPSNDDFLTVEVRSYLQQQAPNVFQQTTGTDHDLISTVQHRNALDLHSIGLASPEVLKYSINSSVPSGISPQHHKQFEIQSVQIAEESNSVDSNLQKSKKPMSRLDKLAGSINAVKSKNDELLAERKSKYAQISALKLQVSNSHTSNEQLRNDAKLHERICLVLENSEENVEKLQTLVATTLERRKTLEQQWQSFREPLVKNLEQLQTSKQAKHAQNIADLRDIINQLEQTLRERTSSHAKLAMKLKNAELNAAPRKEYTRRILEFIGNIRKQRNDIFKVLDDTRNLQKQLNSVTAQLQRQFNYTDDLLFQSAKHDMHAKRAYKLLASLHSTCNDLVELVSQTGSITKEIRDLEGQIDRERSKNIGVSLAQISSDIQNFENVIKNVQLEIQKVESNPRTN